MKPPPFEYAAPTSVDEAVEVLTAAGDEAKLLAGGQSLMPLLALRLASPTTLVDLGRVEGLDRIAVDDHGALCLGALVRQRVVERHDVVRRQVPLLTQAVPHIGHAAIRNWGTVGGSLAHADPAAELPAVALAADATMVVRSPRGTRTVAAGDFFVGYLTTALEPDEVLVEVRYPAWAPRTGSDFQEFSRRHGDFAVVAVAATVTLDASGEVASARVALAGVDTTPVRIAEAEKVLVGARPSGAAWREAADVAASRLRPPDDLHGSSAYRRHLAGVLVERALAAAATQAASSAATQAAPAGATQAASATTQAAAAASQAASAATQAASGGDARGIRDQERHKR